MRPVSFSGQNDIRLLHSGAEYFPALIEAFDAATSEIYLETYIFAFDDTASSIKAALIRAAQRGVTVNVMTDWLGTGNRQSQILQRDFDASGVAVRHALADKFAADKPGSPGDKNFGFIGHGEN